MTEAYLLAPSPTSDGLKPDALTVHITNHTFLEIPVLVWYYLGGQWSAVTCLEQKLYSKAKFQCRAPCQSVNPRFPQPVQSGGHARKWAVLSIPFNSAMSSSVKSTTLRLPDITRLYALRVDNMLNNRLTDDTLGRDGLRYDFLKHGSADFNRWISPGGNFLPFTLGVLTWNETSTLAGVTLYFSARRRTTSFFKRGDWSEPSGE